MPQNVICIVVERLHAGLVGALGNSWIGTAAIDDLAAESFVFDQAYLERTDLAACYESLWRGRPVPGADSLPKLLSAGGWHTALVTDSAQVAELAPAAEFSEKLLVEPADEPRTAGDVAETELARLFGSASDWLAGAREPFCLWLHSQGMAGAWDAPLAMRNRFAEEDDPEPPKLVTPPNHWLPDRFDPDEPLGIKHAYAGQVSLLDMCLGGLLEALAASPLASSTAVVLVSTGGFPLGEHRRIGPCDEALYNELTQLVWMMRFPEELGRLARSQALVTLSDLPAALLEWLGLEGSRLNAGHASSLLDVVRGESAGLRDHLRMVSGHDRAVRTSAWHLRQPVTGAAELYAKPSDRWEVNEVANLLPDVVEGLEAVLAAPESSAGEPAAPLAELLTTELD